MSPPQKRLLERVLPSKDILERAKLSVGILIYLAVIFLVALAVFKFDYLAAKVGSTFSKAGMKLEQVAIFGVTLKFATETMSRTQEVVEELKRAYALLVCQSKGQCSDPDKQKIAAIVSSSPGLQKELSETQQELKQAIQQTESITRAVEQQGPALPGGWIVILGSDRTLDAAGDEARKVRSWNVTILFRDQRYRTVVRFANEADARGNLDKIAAAVGRQPYVRNFNEWCPQAVQQTGFVRCGHGSG